MVTLHKQTDTCLLFPNHFHKLLLVQTVHVEQSLEPECSCATCVSSTYMEYKDKKVFGETVA